MYNSSVCAVLVSEELEDPIIVEEGLAGLRYFSLHAVRRGRRGRGGKRDAVL